MSVRCCVARSEGSCADNFSGALRCSTLNFKVDQFQVRRRLNQDVCRRGEEGDRLEDDSLRPEVPQPEPDQVCERSIDGFTGPKRSVLCSRNCWQNYVDFYRCTNLRGEAYEPCQFFYKNFKTICPFSWVEKWDEQRENGTFPAKL